MGEPAGKAESRLVSQHTFPTWDVRGSDDLTLCAARNALVSDDWLDGFGDARTVLESPHGC